MPGSRPLARPLDLVRRLRRRSGSRPTLAPRRTKARNLGALAGGLLIAGLATGPRRRPSPRPPRIVDLGDASSYAVLSGASVATPPRPGAAHTTRRGDLGVKAERTAGFRRGVHGHNHVGDAAAAAAHANSSGVHEVAARSGGSAPPGELAGSSIAPGLTWSPARCPTRGGSLDGGGDPNAVFVFQVWALAMAAGSHVVLTNGATHPVCSGRSTGPAPSARTPTSRERSWHSTRSGWVTARWSTAACSRATGRLAGRQPVLQRPARGHHRRWPGRDHDRYDPDRLAARPIRGTGCGHRHDRRQTLTATPRGRMVGDLGDPAERHLPGRRLGQRRGRQRGDRHPAADRRHGPSRRQHRRRTLRDDNDPTPTIAGTSDAAAGTVVRVTVDAQR